MSTKLGFPVVLEEELAAIQLRRSWMRLDSVQGEEVLPDHNAHQPSSSVIANDIFGVALSGGGIRSATFNLGLLQALAEQKLLSNCDYLSTVSGGGYIGSWLTAWIRRDGDVRNVERQLVPDKESQARSRCPTGENARLIDEREPEPFRQIRANSNYLAPRPGLFTSDSWELIVIYCRNVFLNLLVLLPTVVSCILLVTTAVSFHGNPSRVNPKLNEILFYSALPTAFVLLALGGGAFYKDMQRARRRCEQVRHGNSNGIGDLSSWRSIHVQVVFAFLIAFLVSLDLSLDESMAKRILGYLPVSNWVAMPCLLAFIHVLFNWQAVLEFIKGNNLLLNLRWILSGLIPGAFEGLLLVGIVNAMDNLPDASFYGVLIPGRLTHAIWGTPVLLLGLFLGESIQLGILGQVEHPLIRERWSTFLSRCMIWAAGWVFVCLHVFYLPIVFFGLQGNWSRVSAAVAWGVTTWGSILIAQGQNTGDARRRGNGWKNLIARLGPVLFLSGCLGGLSIAMVTLASVTNVIGRLNQTNWFNALQSDPGRLAVGSAIFVLGSILCSTMVDINIFSLQEMYQNRLVRCYLGASRTKRGKQFGAPIKSQERTDRNPDELTDIDPGDDIFLEELQQNNEFGKHYHGPIHLINVAINLNQSIELERQERKAASFTFSPYHCGSTVTGYRRTIEHQHDSKGSIRYGGGMTLGHAMAISGAAVSPNMGYYSSPAVTALLTLLNLRLGAWRGNPARREWNRSGPRIGWAHLLNEMLGNCDATSPYVYLSDGGHFDNLGVYELIRRRCRVIIASDAGQDANGSCGELARLIRKVYVDFGTIIDIDVKHLIPDEKTGWSRDWMAIGIIHYPPRDGETTSTEEIGYLFYVKMTMTSDEPMEVLSYRQRHEDFPHRSTADQFFSESQFESYRKLGYHIGKQCFQRDIDLERHPLAPPSSPRTSNELFEYFHALRVRHQNRSSEHWDNVSSELDQRYSNLLKALVTNAHLQKLRLEMQSLSRYLDCVERLRFGSKGSSENDENKAKAFDEVKKHWRTSRSSTERGEEAAWIIDAAVLLSELCFHQNIEEMHTSISREWGRVLRMWPLSSAWDREWGNLELEFASSFREVIRQVREDSKWIDLDRLRSETVV